MSAKPNNIASILLAKHLKELGLPFEREYPFASQIGRKWRFDFVLLDLGNIEILENGMVLSHPPPIAIEIEGAIWAQGRHTRGKGFQEDLVKYNHAMMMGYRVLRFSTEDVLRGRARAFLKMHMETVEHGGQSRGARLGCGG